MSKPSSRYIYTMQHSYEIADLLQTLFISELLAPSRCLWLVSPWISDVPVLDNSGNQLTSFEPSWARRKVLLSEVIAKLIEMDCAVRIATRPDRHNQTFKERLEAKVGVDTNWRIYERAILHNKGLLGDDYFLNGSMNFTYNGIFISEEHVHFTTDMKDVAENRIVMSGRWGDERS